MDVWVGMGESAVVRMMTMPMSGGWEASMASRDWQRKAVVIVQLQVREAAALIRLCEIVKYYGH